MNQQSRNVIANQPHTLLAVLVPSRRPSRPPRSAIKGPPGRRAGNSDFAPQTQKRRVLILGEFLRMTGQPTQGSGTRRCVSCVRKGEERKTNPIELTCLLSTVYRRTGRNKPKRG